MESALGCNEISSRTQAVMARHHFEILEACLEAGSKQIQAVFVSTSPRDLLNRQTVLVSEFSEKLIEMTQELMDIHNQARVEIELCVEDGLSAVQVIPQASTESSQAA
jgi:hypothetical protein